MMALEEYLEVHALRRRGWSISAIARHVGKSRRTVRAYLSGDRVPGQRARAGSDLFDAFEAYVRQRLSDDPHVWGSALFDEVVALGYSQSYPTFVRKIRCRACGRLVAPVGALGAVLWRSLIIRRVRSVNGIGWSYATRRGEPRLMCWWVCCRTRALFGRGSRPARTNPIWWRVSTRC